MATSNGHANHISDSELSKLDEVKKTVGESIQNLRTLLKASRDPLPTETGDGTQLTEEEHIAGLSEKFATAIRDATTAGWGSLVNVLKAGEGMHNGKPLDDKKYFMEYLIQIAAKIPDDVVSNKITDTMITTLWQDLSHPPETLMGGDFEFRQPDGSNNCYKNPTIGAAGMPYARTVNPKTLQPGNMPDPGILFDTLMARKEPEEHPNKISSMLFYLASIIIHDCFKTNHTDYRFSDTSSYLDLAPLYGSNWKDQKRMRTFKDGKILPDCFSETRLLSFPPGVGCLLIMFNRYHNYVAEQLAAINENGRFTPSEKTVDRYGEKGLNKRDDDLFQTARLITCGIYVNIILVDYVRTILNMQRTDSNWQLNPRKDIKDGPPMATGNQVSAEFNLVYRWHASISTRDEKWTEALSAQMWAGATSMSEVPQYEIMKTLKKTEEHLQSLEPNERPFPALESETMTRITEGPYKGNFKDDEIAEFLTSGIEDCANAMGPQQVPICMRAIEILGIQQARTWQLSTLNELREHFGLQRHRKFSDITSNTQVAEALKHLYDTPDNVELYPGLVVEDAKSPMAPGSGLCPSYTVSRGVLSDATALVRGDRFYTTAFTPAQYTNWGYQECQSDPTIDNGCVLYKLFLRTLPHNYDPSSVYVHYPFTVPTEMKSILQDLKKDHKYKFERPTPIPEKEMIVTYEAATKIMNDQDTFKTTWGRTIEFLMGPEAKKFMLAGDEPVNAESRVLMENALYQGESSRAIPKGNEKWLREVKAFYENITTKLLEQKSYKLGAINQVDLIRDVGNLAHVHFSAELFNLPLKTDENPTGIFTEQQLYLIMSAIFICIFFDVDPAKSFPLRQQARDVVQKLGEILKIQVSAIQKGGSLAEKVLTAIRPTSTSPLKDYGVHMISQLLKKDSNIDSLVWGNLMETAGSMVSNQGQLLAQSIDYIFTQGREHIPTLHKLALSDSEEDFDILTHYFMEFSRLAGETALFRRVAKPTTVVDGSRTHEFKEGDEIFINLKAASRDPKAFPNPNAVDPTRPMESYIHLGHGPHQCLGLPIVRVACTTMLRKFFQLENLRPATVSVGRQSVESSVKKLVKEFVPGDSKVMPEGWSFHVYLMEDWDMFFPFPTSELTPVWCFVIESFYGSLTFYFRFEDELGWRDSAIGRFRYRRSGDLCFSMEGDGGIAYEEKPCLTTSRVPYHRRPP
jgi:hypothetical protein